MKIEQYDIIPAKCLSSNEKERLLVEGYEEVTVEEFEHNIKNKKSLYDLILTVNIHQLFAVESEANIDWLIENYESELKEYINAIVFLSLKKRGRGKTLNCLSQKEFTDIVKRVMEKEIPMGFDSCSCNKIAQAFIDLGKQVPIDEMEPCESTCISSYFSADGTFYPCSFSEEPEFAIPISEVTDFYKDLWFNKKTIAFREKLLNNIDKNGIRSCPRYEI